QNVIRCIIAPTNMRNEPALSPSISLLRRRLTCLGLNLVTVLALAACGARGSGVAAPINTPSQQPTPLSLDDAQRVAGDFLNAWTAGDYDGMYRLLTHQSQDAFPRQDFGDLYATTEQKITLLAGGKSYALTNALRRGITVEMAYDMTFKTRL